MRSIPLALLAFSLGACSSMQDVELESRNIHVEENAVPTAAGSGTEGMAKLVQTSGPSYVTLVVSKPQTEGTVATRDSKRGIAITSGSGFIVDATGYVITAAHVAVSKGNSVAARAANGRVYSGTVVGILPENDMALIQLRGFQGRAVVPTSNLSLARGSMVYSLGKPHDQGDTARVGSVQSMHFGRAVSYGKFGYPDAIVLQMSTQKGESGGPLFDRSGTLVGMVVSTLTDASGNLLNLAHAVPANRLAGFLCGHVSCSTKWSQLAAQSTDSCPKI